MKSEKLVKDLIADMQELQCVHGNLPIVVRHMASNEFGADDNLEICRVFYDAREDVFVLLVVS